MEQDVVLADEVVNPHVLFGVPEFLPGLGLANDRRPLHGGRQITQQRLVPHVEALAFGVGQRDGNAPRQVAREGARLGIGCIVTREIQHGATPVAALIGQVSHQLLA